MWEAGELQTRTELESKAMLASKDPSVPIHVRDKASINASTIYDGKAGDKVAIIGYPNEEEGDNNSNWCQVKFKEFELTGWVLEDFIEFEEVRSPLS